MLSFSTALLLTTKTPKVQLEGLFNNSNISGTAVTSRMLTIKKNLIPLSMLIFYKHTSDVFTDRVEQKLRDMVIAHKIIEVDSTDSLPEEVIEDDLPVLSDNHRIWISQTKIENFLEELHQEVKLGRSLQSDSCHLDPENPDRCL